MGAVMRAAPVVLLPSLWKMIMDLEVNVIQPPYPRLAFLRELLSVEQPSSSFLPGVSLKVLLFRRRKLVVMCL